MMATEPMVELMLRGMAQLKETVLQSLDCNDVAMRNLHFVRYAHEPDRPEELWLGDQKLGEFRCEMVGTKLIMTFVPEVED